MQQINQRPIDKFFLLSVSALTIVGFIVFLSASLGLLAQDGASFGTVALKQTISLVIGIGAFFAFAKIKYQYIRKLAFFILIGAIVINLLLFIPGLAFHHGGAARWIDLWLFSFQPSEFLKIAFIIYMAAWAQFAKDKIEKMRFGLFPYLVVMAILSTLLLVQSDTDTLIIIGFTGIVMLIVAGLPMRHMVIAGVLMLVLVGGVIWFRPYAFQRFQTFLNNGADSQGAGYQINQSLIAIGSGQFSGRGFGQSVQKFGYLPEPIGDSIFAVGAEEFGFVGTIALLALYLVFAVSVFRVGTRSPDVFGALVSIGIAVLIITESFMNMAAMMGIIPLSGLPLLFISHGGTALIIVLAASGIVANVSKHGK